jgi:nucleoside-diphosphate-sugar epimerase
MYVAQPGYISSPASLFDGRRIHAKGSLQFSRARDIINFNGAQRMAHVVLTGASGLVGSGVLNQLLAQPPTRISHISILGRRSSPLAEGKSNVTFYEHKDFLEYPAELIEKLKATNPPPSAVIWALGISQTQVSKEEYVVITEKYPLAAAKAFAGLNDRVNFVYVSGEGVS